MLYLALEQMQHVDFDYVEQRLLNAASESVKTAKVRALSSKHPGSLRAANVADEMKKSPSFNHSYLQQDSVYATPSMGGDEDILNMLNQVETQRSLGPDTKKARANAIQKVSSHEALELPPVHAKLETPASAKIEKIVNFAEYQKNPYKYLASPEEDDKKSLTTFVLGTEDPSNSFD